MTDTARNVVGSCVTLAIVIGLILSVLFIIGVGLLIAGWV